LLSIGFSFSGTEISSFDPPGEIRIYKFPEL
jgi:hypothetical protein